MFSNGDGVVDADTELKSPVYNRWNRWRGYHGICTCSLETARESRFARTFMCMTHEFRQGVGVIRLVDLSLHLQTNTGRLIRVSDASIRVTLKRRRGDFTELRSVLTRP